MLTPQEIFEYKQRWMSTGDNNPVRLHSDVESRGKEWCHRQLQKHQWNFSKWTDVYEHTFYFEDARAAKEFEMEMKPYSNME